MNRRPLVFAAALTSAAVLAAASRPSRADDTKVACVSAFDRAQAMRKDGKLLEAREQLATCSADACPEMVRADCASMMADVVAAQPTVVLDAVEQTRQDLVEVRAFVDGKLVASSMDGKPVPLDPGEHVVRFERPDGSHVEQRVVVLAGQKNRVVTATFPVAGAPAGSAGAEGSQPAGRRPWVLGLGLIGAGVIAGGVALALDVWAVQQANADRGPGGCAANGPYCPNAEVDSLRTREIVAGVVGGVGAVAAGVGALVLFTGGKPARAPRSGSASLRVTAAPSPGGAAALVTGEF